MVELGGVDVISFSGGIGEYSPYTRSAVCKNLSAFGVELDEAINSKARTAQKLSTEGSAVKVLIIPADEESVVARETVNVVQRVSAGQTI